jgi:hypothetical protein
MASRGGKISTQGTARGRSIDLSIHIDGLDRTSDEFKHARREMNMRIKEVMRRVGEREVLPDLRAGLPGAIGGKDIGMYVQRERSGVFIGSKLRGTLNRALGWWDFGGKRPMDFDRRTGPKVIFKTLDKKRDRIDDAVLDELLDAFHPLDTRRAA